MARIRRSLKMLGVSWLACGAWLGCNALLGNQSAEFDPEAAAKLDATTGTDGTSGDGPTDDGNGGSDGSNDGEPLDGGDGATPCVDLATNPLHCGSCNHDCRGGSCVDGGCLPLVIATDVPGPDSIALDSTHVYWINAETNDVWSVQHDGGGKKLLYDGPVPGSGTSLAIYGGNVYFGSAADVDASVLRCATPSCAGGPQVEVPNRDVPVSVFVKQDTGQLYFTQSVPSGSVERCKLPCNGATQIVVSGAAQAFPNSIAVTPDDTIFWTTLNGTPTKLNMKLPTEAPDDIAGGAITAVTPTTGEVYYIDESLGPTAVPLDGGSPRRLLTTFTAGRHLALDTNVVYATESQKNLVYSCERVGCGDAGTVLARNQNTPRGITFNATFLFWVNHGDVGTGGQVVRLAR